MAGLAQILEEARVAGRSHLDEVESYAAARALGVAVPDHFVVSGPAGVTETALAALGGDRVVVKAMVEGMVHKSAAGAVRVAAAAPTAVRDAISAIRSGLAPRPVGRFVVAAVVPHGDAELMIGYRRTAAFGRVVTLGPGGVHADALAAALGVTVLGTDAGTREVARAVAEGPVGRFAWGGTPPDVVERVLAEVVRRARRIPDAVAEIDLNPVAVTDRGAVALDALCRIGPPPGPGRPDLPPGAVGAMLIPEKIAIVGVSSGENVGRTILRNVLAAGFPADRVTVVKHGVAEVEGVACVPSVREIPSSVDLLVVAVGASGVPDLLAETVGRASGVVLIPGGVGERAGSEPLAERVRAIVADARRSGRGPVVCGANCMGIRSLPGGYDATFIPPERLAARPDARVAPLAVISQSGAFAIARLDRFPHLQPRYLVTVGNQVDLTVGDFLAHAARDPEVSVAACYVEGFEPGDGSRFLAAARRLAHRGGAVVLALAGRTDEGRRSAGSHTAAIATDVVVAERLAAAAGVLVASTLEEFEDLVALAVSLGGRSFPGLRIGAVSNAGFEAVAFADGFGGCIPAVFSQETESAVAGILDRAGVGDVVSVANPLDLTPMTGDRGYGEAVGAVLDDPGVDLAVVGCVPLTPALRARSGELGPGSIADELVGLAGHATPWVAVVEGGGLYDDLRSRLAAAGIPVFTTADRAAGALSRYARWRVDR